MPLPADDLASLFAFNRWANERTLASVRPLPESDYVRELGGGWPSVRATLVHLAGATAAWVERFSGRDATRLVAVEEAPAYADAEALLRSAQEGLEGLLPCLTPVRLAEPFRWKNLQGVERSTPLWAAVRHTVNHGTYHRGQISSMVRRLGGKPAATDMVLWGVETSSL